MSSQTGRATLNTLMRGKMDDKSLMALFGWDSTEMPEHYDKGQEERLLKETIEFWEGMDSIEK